MKLTINLFTPIWIIGAIILGIYGLVSWWVLALVVTSTIKVLVTFKI